jgi:hypothetical protein
MMKQLIPGTMALLVAGSLWAAEPARPPKQPTTPAALQAEIEALRDGRVAWRQIAWKSCLLDGLRESRAKNKPLLLWVFIDRPADDARC